ncbi:sigma-70 family RNA polymerase sigma factor [Micromonospora sp. 067-2]|uniref:sigma-70 family RNA polymerase sigma factor n=1 Tax=Micromonospora sp. 067-2 TaxID=2789270 RepID=UPI00397ACA9B
MRKQTRSTTTTRDVRDEFAALQESMTANEYAVCYEQERLPLVRFLIYRGAAPQDAFDAAQHAFVEAWRRWEQIHNPRTWLRTVAIRAVAKANQPTVPLDEKYDIADSAPLGSQVSEETMDLVAALRQLPPAQREIMVWTIDGFAPSEIAKELGLSPEAARQGLHRARENMKSILFPKEGRRS